MSFILDALRRADAQRERDSRRGIHAQTAPLPGDEDEPRWVGPRPLARQLLPWAAALVAVLAALVGWREVRAPAQAWPDARSLPAQPSAVPPAPAILPPPAPALVPAPPADARPAAPSRAASGGAATVSKTSSTAAPAAPAASGLPADAPLLRITGGVYAASPGQRLLIVNGQVHGEGAEPVPGVRVEQIGPKAAVLRFRGQRYEVGF